MKNRTLGSVGSDARGLAWFSILRSYPPDDLPSTIHSVQIMASSVDVFTSEDNVLKLVFRPCNHIKGLPVCSARRRMHICSRGRSVGRALCWLRTFPRNGYLVSRSVRTSVRGFGYSLVLQRYSLSRKQTSTHRPPALGRANLQRPWRFKREQGVPTRTWRPPGMGLPLPFRSQLQHSSTRRRSALPRPRGDAGQNWS